MNINQFFEMKINHRFLLSDQTEVLIDNCMSFDELVGTSTVPFSYENVDKVQAITGVHSSLQHVPITTVNPD